MKIKLQANSARLINTLKSNNFDAIHGYSYNMNAIGDNNVQNSWFVRIAAKLDKLLTNNLSDSDNVILIKNESEIASYIAKSAEFLNNHVEKTELIDGMKIQINASSKIDKGIDLLSESIKNMSFPAYIKIKESMDTHAGNIFSEMKKMIIGVNIFSNNNEYSVNPIITEKFGIEKSVNFTIFHEASHAFQFKNNEILGQNVSESFKKTLQKSQELGYNPDKLFDINKTISKSDVSEISNLPVLYAEYLREISALHKEIYADTGAILLLRNKSFVENNYDSEKSKEFINEVMNARNKGHNVFDEYINIRAGSFFNHLTSPGLDYLKENYDSLPKRIMTQEEIHQICQETIKQGFARVLITSVAADNNNVGQLKTLFHINLEKVDIYDFSISGDENRYKESMDELKSLAGASWLNNFQKKVQELETKNLSNLNLAVWFAGVDEKALDNYLAREVLVKKEREQSLASLQPEINMMKDSILKMLEENCSSSNDNSIDVDSEIKRTSGVVEKMKNMRKLHVLNKTNLSFKNKV